MHPSDSELLVTLQGHHWINLSDLVGMAGESVLHCARALSTEYSCSPGTSPRRRYGTEQEVCSSAAKDSEGIL
jgi:hypothetical protein